MFWLIRDVVQKKHTVLRNYPLIGHMRYFLEKQGEFFRQYLVSGERDEMPFNRATRNWVYRTSKNVGGMIGFGSTYDLREPGSLIFVNAPFPLLEAEKLPTPALMVGNGYCRDPYLARSLVNISGMSYGSLSAPAIQALSKGAAEANCWISTGEGGLSPHHMAGNCERIMQIGTARYGIRDQNGAFSKARALELAEHVCAFEIKLSQGAKPGRGGMLPHYKVSEEVAQIRGIPVGEDSYSPNRHSDIENIDQLLDRIAMIRDLTGKPVGVKTAIGGLQFSNDLCESILRRGFDYAPDFLVIDGGEGGSGAAPQILADHMGMSIMEALPRVVDDLLSAGIKERIRVVASGKLLDPAKVAWALCTGADFVNSARGFMFALGCIQAMRCYNNTCPTGITTHNKRLQRGLVVEDKAIRVANYARGINREVEMIAHACGVRHPRELRREHVRLVQTAGHSTAMNILFPYPEGLSKPSIE
ncbi:MAG: FMN-binding glutamate synthase family protein [Gallionella sp.]